MIQFLLSELGGYILAGGGVIIAIAAAWFKGRSSGKAVEQARQQAKRAKINRQIDTIEDDVADNTPAENREELKRWSD